MNKELVILEGNMNKVRVWIKQLNDSNKEANLKANLEEGLAKLAKLEQGMNKLQVLINQLKGRLKDTNKETVITGIKGEIRGAHTNIEELKEKEQKVLKDLRRAIKKAEIEEENVTREIKARQAKIETAIADGINEPEARRNIEEKIARSHALIAQLEEEKQAKINAKLNEESRTLPRPLENPPPSPSRKTSQKQEQKQEQNQPQHVQLPDTTTPRRSKTRTSKSSQKRQSPPPLLATQKREKEAEVENSKETKSTIDDTFCKTVNNFITMLEMLYSDVLDINVTDSKIVKQNISGVIKHIDNTLRSLNEEGEKRIGRRRAFRKSSQPLWKIKCLKMKNIYIDIKYNLNAYKTDVTDHGINNTNEYFLHLRRVCDIYKEIINNNSSNKSLKQIVKTINEEFEKQGINIEKTAQTGGNLYNLYKYIKKDYMNIIG